MVFNWRRAAKLELYIGGGQIPTQRHFRRLRSPLWIVAYGVHDNPWFYKHHWQIWTWRDVLTDEQVIDFRRRFGPYPWQYVVPELSFSEAMKQMQALCARGERFFVADERVKRDDPEMWNVELTRAKGGRLAPAYDDDPDEPFFGHK